MTLKCPICGQEVNATSAPEDEASCGNGHWWRVAWNIRSMEALEGPTYGTSKQPICYSTKGGYQCVHSHHGRFRHYHPAIGEWE